MSKTNNQKPRGTERTLRDDHSELDKLINKLLKTLDQKNKAKSFELLFEKSNTHVGRVQFARDFGLE